MDEYGIYIYMYLCIYGRSSVFFWTLRSVFFSPCLSVGQARSSRATPGAAALQGDRHRPLGLHLAGRDPGADRHPGRVARRGIWGDDWNMINNWLIYG